ncbi:pectin lyase-like protein [Rhizodiscina lignyota]|uniref:galacturonan 1,4-alpha-galacturonidase n=1 Tax=Rhizodiscina lignyota TaxID=1504668 RepID=A0A9P4IPY4_9PEZI|nr:pectin lyase-like protein [Rhizodiscina lignyota]
MRFKQILSILSLSVCVPSVVGYVVNNGTSCYLYPESLTHFGQPVDDTPSILQAFELCGINGSVIFTENTFHINQIMNTTNLQNCDVTLAGELQFSTNVPYWLSHSINVGLQNQSTAWLIGGTNLSFRGVGSGWINGNGQTWYTENKSNANQPRRPITMTFYNSTNLFVDNLNITQPQFWAIFVSFTKNATLNNIYVNATSNDQWSTTNTDGADTWNSHGVFMTNWTVQNGDDCIAAKGNTSELYVKNATCIGGNGMTIGSVGQYPLMPDYNENTVFEDVRVIDSGDGAYIKTWQGIAVGESSNGDAGGGGPGYVRNVTFKNFQIENVGLPIQISQCIYSEANASNCETSKMAVSNITWENFSGTSRYNIAASLHCAGSHPCPDIFFRNVNISSVNETKGEPAWNTTLQKEIYQCANILNENSTSGIPCNRWAPSNFGQGVSGNIQESGSQSPSRVRKYL